MATELLIEDRFECSPERLCELLMDNAFDDELMRALDMGKELLETKKVDDDVIYRIRLTDPEKIPAIAVKFTGEHLSYVETRTWHRKTLSNQWTIDPDVKGAKVEAKGVTEIVADGGGALRRTRGTISVNLPLIGKKIEAMVLSGIETTFKRNAEYCREYLKSHDA